MTENSEPGWGKPPATGWGGQDEHQAEWSQQPAIEEPPEIVYTMRRVHMSKTERILAGLAVAVVAVGGVVAFLMLRDDKPETARPVVASTTTLVQIADLPGAQGKYFEFAGTANNAIADIERAGTETPEQYVAFCAGATRVHRDFAAALRSYDGWGSATDSVEKLATSLDDQADLEATCATTAPESPDLALLRANIIKEADKGSKAASEARVALGLPLERR